VIQTVFEALKKDAKSSHYFKRKEGREKIAAKSAS
jgi:hypothetical protein